MVSERRSHPVPLWSGREVRALREARRMSVREFAAHLGVSDRMVSKWEAGGPTIRPRPVNQAALDTSLALATPETASRFWLAISAGGGGALARYPQPSGGMPVATHLVRHPEDGKLMTLVETGITPLGPDDEPVWQAGYYIDVFPTSNADYVRFLAATDHEPPGQWPDRRPPQELIDHPVVGVNVADAQAYAAWTAKRLPTGAQWEKAARGPDGLTYPWGAEATPMRCNVREARVKGTTPVDWYDTGISPYGVYDLCGNVWEWCATPATRGWQVRGGAFSTAYQRVRPSTFHDLAPHTRRDDLGFRCVLSLEAMLELLSI